MWVFEGLYPDIKIGLKGELIYKKKSSFQDLRIYKTPFFGNVLMLDGAIQTTQKDEFIYHEMLTHPLVLSHPKPDKVLVIGAGDGGIIRELLKHKNIKKVVLVEIDEEVINLSKKYLKTICKSSFSDKRVEVGIADGAKYLKETKDKFDIAIVDSPDPIGVAKVLFTKKFYTDIYNVLNENGMLIRQTGSSFLQSKELKENYKIFKNIFPEILAQVCAIPTYIGGFFTLLVGAKGVTPLDIDYKKLNKKFNKLNLKTKYYNPEIHFASFALPNYLKEGIGE